MSASTAMHLTPYVPILERQYSTHGYCLPYSEHKIGYTTVTERSRQRSPAYSDTSRCSSCDSHSIDASSQPSSPPSSPVRTYQNACSISEIDHNPATSPPPRSATSPKTFTLFPLLPLCLQIFIWEFAVKLALPRLIRLLQLSTYDIGISARVPALLHTCYESRRQGLKRWKPSFHTRTVGASFFVDFKTDMFIFFADNYHTAFWWEPFRDFFQRFPVEMALLKRFVLPVSRRDGIRPRGGRRRLPTPPLVENGCIQSVHRPAHFHDDGMALARLVLKYDFRDIFPQLEEVALMQEGFSRIQPYDLLAVVPRLSSLPAHDDRALVKLFQSVDKNWKRGPGGGGLKRVETVTQDIEQAFEFNEVWRVNSCVPPMPRLGWTREPTAKEVIMYEADLNAPPRTCRLFIFPREYNTPWNCRSR
jgi:hypothetical protein